MTYRPRERRAIDRFTIISNRALRRNKFELVIAAEVYGHAGWPLVEDVIVIIVVFSHDDLDGVGVLWEDVLWVC